MAPIQTAQSRQEEDAPAALAAETVTEVRSPVRGPVLRIAQESETPVAPGGHPVYSLRDPWLLGGREEFKSIPELARHYVEAVRENQPEGPYNLLGLAVRRGGCDDPCLSRRQRPTLRTTMSRVPSVVAESCTRAPAVL
jgi:hypothetical protein